MKNNIDISLEFPSYIPGRLAITRSSHHVIIQTKPYSINHDIFVDASSIISVSGLCRKYRIVGELTDLFLADSYCNQCNSGLFAPILASPPFGTSSQEIVHSIICPACLARYSRIGDVWTSGYSELYIKVSELYTG